MRDDSDNGRRRNHEAESKHPNLRPVPAYDVRRRVDCFPVQERRKEDNQHQIRIELQMRQGRNEAQTEAAEHEHDRIGNIRTPRQRDQRYRNAEQSDKNPEIVLFQNRVPRSNAYLPNHRRHHAGKSTK